MRFTLFGLAACLSACGALTGAASASISHTFTFDGVPSGTSANALSQPSGLNVAFQFGVYLPNLDSFGDPIPGSEHWQVDTSAPNVQVTNPTAYLRPAAPSPSNALNALDQPVMVIFGQPTSIDPNGFSIVSANGAFGFNGNLPGLEDYSAQFYTPAATLIGSVAINQTVQGSVAAAGGFSGVGFILIPSGAFYDNLSLTVTVPAPASVALIGLGGLAATRRRRN